VEPYQFIAALTNTFNYRLFPTFYKVKLKRDTHFFEKAQLFSKESFKPCVNLNRTTLTADGKLNITLYERYAKSIKYLRVENLPLKYETGLEFKEAKTGYIDFTNVYVHALPDFAGMKLVKISKNLHALSNGRWTRESLCEYWEQVHRIKLPANVRDPDSRTIFFCLTDTGDVYPSCCLVHNVMKPEKIEEPGMLAAKFLSYSRDVLHSMGLFGQQGEQVQFSNMLARDIAKTLSMNEKHFIKLSERTLKRLNTNAPAVKSVAAMLQAQLAESPPASSSSSSSVFAATATPAENKPRPSTGKKRRAVVDKENVDQRRAYFKRKKNVDPLAILDGETAVEDDDGEYGPPPASRKRLESPLQGKSSGLKEARGEENKPSLRLTRRQSLLKSSLIFDGVERKSVGAAAVSVRRPATVIDDDELIELDA
jgi:hypothetical protein